MSEEDFASEQLSGWSVLSTRVKWFVGVDHESQVSLGNWRADCQQLIGGQVLRQDVRTSFRSCISFVLYDRGT